jgi:ectoine hydroxylase-related dioxygenase (phytanoyl-CoA dioxygenase family)
MTSPASANASLSHDVRSRYERDGYLVLRGVFGADEVAALDGEAQTLLDRRELVHTDNIRCRWQNHVESGECMFDCFDPVIDIGPVCRAVARDERILAALRAIYRDEPHLFKDKLIFKRPGAEGYKLHQDFIGWKEFPESFITVIVAIDRTEAANGATEVFAGGHRQGYLSPRDGMYHELSLDAFDASRPAPLELAPGDIALFGGFMPHRSAANRSTGWRRQLYLSYNARRDGGEQRESHYRQFHAWLGERYAEYGRKNTYFR